MLNRTNQAAEVVEIEAINSSSNESESSGELWNIKSEPETPNTVEARGKHILQDLELELPPINVFTRPAIAPWDYIRIPLDKSLQNMVRNGMSSAEIRTRFTCMKSTKYRVYQTIFTDGSKRGNSCAYSVVYGERIIRKRINGGNSIYAAECFALKEVFTLILSENHIGAYLICTDSLSAISSLENFKIKSIWQEEIVQMYRQLKIRGNAVKICWVPSHIGIKGNEKADLEAKRALNEPVESIVPINFPDIKATIKKRFLWKWQAEWNATRSNKLREIKSLVTPYTAAFTGKRSDDTKLARLRIGHTCITHRHLLERDIPPRCRCCNAPLSVRHIIADCPVLEDERRRANIPPNMKEALADDRRMAEKVLTYLKNINMYCLI